MSGPEHLQLGRSWPVRRSIIAVVVMCCLVVAGGLWWLTRPDGPDSAPPPAPTSTHPQSQSPTAPRTVPQSTGPTRTAPPTRPVDPRPATDEMRPRGTLVVRRADRGPARVALPKVAAKGSYVTVRIACLPDGGPFQVSVEATGRLLMRSTCSGEAVTGASFTADTSSLAVTVDVADDASWRIAIWST